MDVYNPNNEKVGDISEIILDKNGNAEVVVIGVGGFLGIGAKDVGVSFKSLQWKMDRPKTASDGAPASRTDSAAPAQSSTREYPDHAVLNMTQDQLKAAPDFKYVGSASESRQPPSTPAPQRVDFEARAIRRSSCKTRAGLVANIPRQCDRPAERAGSLES
jgi:hypothetical protein